MLRTRVMPCLLLRNGALVKTIQFKTPSYIGDPANAIRIFNEKEVDELVVLDITASIEQKPPQFQLLREIASECFMPMSYGGGIKSLEHIRELLFLGIEKVAINSYAVENPDFVRSAAERFGSSTVIVSIDAKKTQRGYEVYTRGGSRATGLDVVKFAVQMQELGAGEIFLNSIDQDGMMQGYDLDLIRSVTKAVSIPVIACGGAGKIDDLGTAVKEGGASAVALGSMVVYFGRNRAVLINFPKHKDLERIFG